MTDPIRHPALTEAIESAIGLNVDCGGTQGVHRVRDAVLDAIQPELDALTALRQIARGYCPECGRGDAAPTVADWEQQKQRADHAEAKVADYENRITWHTTCESCARLLDSGIRETERAEKAEAALERVRAVIAERRTEVAEEVDRLVGQVQGLQHLVDRAVGRVQQ